MNNQSLRKPRLPPVCSALGSLVASLCLFWPASPLLPDEVISDLLKPERTNLVIREDRKKGVFVEGLSEWVVRSPKEVYGLIKRGTSLRATGSTRINETSSRSHALFVIIIEQNELTYDEEAPPPMAQGGDAGRPVVRQSFKVGKLNLVDLFVTNTRNTRVGAVSFCFSPHVCPLLD